MNVLRMAKKIGEGPQVDAQEVSEATAHIRELPTLPSVLGQVLAAVADPESSALELSRYIAADQSLSAALLRLVNSAHYGFYRQINNVTDAIVILGFVEVRNLILTTTAFHALNTGRSEFDRTQLWRHALAAAVAAEKCAKGVGRNAGEAFICGLLHDIGKVALDRIYPDVFAAVVCRAREGNAFVRDVERDVFGMDHAEVGAILADHWALPTPITDAIQRHHVPETAVENAGQADLAALGNFLAYEAGLGESSNGCPPLVPQGSIDHLRISEAQRQSVCKDLRDNRRRIDAILGALAS